MIQGAILILAWSWVVKCCRWTYSTLISELKLSAAALDWYLHHLGLIVSGFLYLDAQRDRGPTMAFIRCDRGTQPADHHTLAMHLGHHAGYVHSAYQVADLDTLAAPTSPSAATAAPGASAATSRAARSSTTGATPTATWSSTSPTETSSTTP